MAKRRKLSDITDQETAIVVNLLRRFQLDLDGDDEDVVHALQTATVVGKFSELKVSFGPYNMPF
jgi:hypothetical protein